MWWNLLAGCAYGITLRITMQIAYYDIPKELRAALMGSIDHETHEMRNIFLSLLTNDKYSLLDDYKQSQLTNLQSNAIFHHYFDKPSLHEFVFPFKLLCNNLSLAMLIRPRLSEYRPGVVSFRLDKHHTFTAEDRIAIVRSIADRITLYGDLAILYCAYESGIGDFSYDIGLMFSLTEQYGSFSKPDYGLRLEELETRRAAIGSFRYAAWRTQLLCLMLMHSTNSDGQKKDSIREYLETVEMDHVPPVLVKYLVLILFKLKLFVNNAIFPPIDAAILKIQKLLPGMASLGGSLPTRNKQWIDYLHEIGGCRLQIPTIMLNHTQLLEWWAAYSHLGRSLLFRRTFDDPLSFLDHRGVPMVCREISCLLDELTLILVTNTSIVQAIDQSSVEVQINGAIIKAYARTLASNVLYLEHMGNLPVSNDLYQCLRDVTFCPRLEMIWLWRLLCEQANMNWFIGIDLLQATSARPSPISSLISLGTVLEVLIDPEAVIFHVIVTIINFLLG
ncbi:hypothetical protein PSACC_00191 [Paramicrosporidium saccamoebae]|uniref:Uncharacterized protein n=1 Tax=Paramicrosporidium saccamoebae TaxID=1246581 RepID=A0A2H9TQS7_9FUNG|nr:hypothetical protein PSACC_00191 [Paramicrosporidium saccamoebae]